MVSQVLHAISAPFALSPAIHQWAVCNIVFIIAGVIGCLFVFAHLWRVSRLLGTYDKKLPSIVMVNDESIHLEHSSLFLTVASVIVVAFGIFVFALTQDLQGKAVFLDLWSFVLAGTSGIQLIVITSVYRQGRLIKTLELDRKNGAQKGQER